jgi:hypothetical protein
MPEWCVGEYSHDPKHPGNAANLKGMSGRPFNNIILTLFKQNGSLLTYRIAALRGARTVPPSSGTRDDDLLLKACYF